MKSFIFLFVISWFSALSFAGQVENGGFETYYNDPCAPASDINSPQGWDSIYFASCENYFQPETEHQQGPRLNWSIPEVAIAPHSGDYCLVLSTDDIGTDDEREWWAQASQKIDFKEGQTIEFYYFFGTFDYPDYSDYGSFVIFDSNFPQDPRHNDTIDPCEYVIGVQEVGPYGSMAGWEKYEYTFTASDANNFDSIAFRVQDRSDKIFKSYFAIDDVKLGTKPDLGDFNDDWVVNFEDFEVFAAHWGLSDPNDLGGCDFDNSNSVGIDDFIIFTEQWLTGSD